MFLLATSAFIPLGEPAQVWRTITQSVQTLRSSTSLLADGNLSNPYTNMPTFQYDHNHPFCQLMMTIHGFARNRCAVGQTLNDSDVFTNVTCIGNGSTATVFSARTFDGRKIALRVARRKIPQDPIIGVHLMTLATQTPFPLAMYGIILMQDPNNARRPITITCMEKADCDVRQFITTNNKKITSSMVFEEFLGDWLIGQLDAVLGDRLYPNIGLKYMPPRVYKIGASTFLFPAGLTPIRLDLDECLRADQPHSLTSYTNSAFAPHDIENGPGKVFASYLNTNASKPPITVLLAEYFASFLIDDNSIPDDALIFHVVLPTS